MKACSHTKESYHRQPNPNAELSCQSATTQNVREQLQSCHSMAYILCIGIYLVLAQHALHTRNVAQHGEAHKLGRFGHGLIGLALLPTGAQTHGQSGQTTCDCAVKQWNCL